MGSNCLKLILINPNLSGLTFSISLLLVIPCLFIYMMVLVITLSTRVRNLGAVFDNEISMIEHINCIKCSCFYHLRQLAYVRHSLTHDLAKMLIHVLISSRVDHCNLLMFVVTGHVIRKLHTVLYAATRLITGLGQYDKITPVVWDELHWLLIKHRIIYKVALLVFKCLHRSGPAYLAEHCVIFTYAIL